MPKMPIPCIARNLNIEEARLRRTREKDFAELQRLQALRQREEAKNPPQPQNGFEFSKRKNATETCEKRGLTTVSPAEILPGQTS